MIETVKTMMQWNKNNGCCCLFNHLESGPTIWTDDDIHSLLVKTMMETVMEFMVEIMTEMVIETEAKLKCRHQILISDKSK